MVRIDREARREGRPIGRIDVPYPPLDVRDDRILAVTLTSLGVPLVAVYRVTRLD